MDGFDRIRMEKEEADMKAAILRDRQMTEFQRQMKRVGVAICAAAMEQAWGR